MSDAEIAVSAAASEAAAKEIAERNARFVQRFMDAVPHVSALGIGYRAHGDDWAELEMPYAPHLIVADGIIASGAIFSLMDSVAGMAVFIALKKMTPHATLDLRLDYPRGPVPGETIIARATCYRVTSSVAFVRGIAHQGNPDRPIANMAGTFMHGTAS